MLPEDERYHRARFVRLDERARVRARRFGGRAERVDLWAVFEGAGWRCAFCGDVIDPCLRWRLLPAWSPPLPKRRTPAERKLWDSARTQFEQERRLAVDNNLRI